MHARTENIYSIFRDKLLLLGEHGLLLMAEQTGDAMLPAVAAKATAKEEVLLFN